MGIGISVDVVLSGMVLGTVLAGKGETCAVGVGAGLSVNPVGKGIVDKEGTLGSVGLVEKAVKSVRAVTETTLGSVGLMQGAARSGAETYAVKEGIEAKSQQMQNLQKLQNLQN
ncbi:hypothetical protein FCV25MIE_00827 [Fagus crenata]